MAITNYPLLGNRERVKRKEYEEKKISKWHIKRGVNFHDEMCKGKYGWNEAAHLGWF